MATTTPAAPTVPESVIEPLASLAPEPHIQEPQQDTAHQEPAAAATGQQGPVYYKHVDLDVALAPEAFAPLEKVGPVYVARMAQPLLVQTPPVTLASPLDDEDGTPLPHVHITLSRQFQQFVQRAEDLVLSACLANKVAWFRRPLEDASLRASFKPFFKAGSGTLKVKVPRDALVFDDSGILLCHEDVPPGTSVRCLLELSRVCFGRTEFGAMWSLRQAQRVASPAAQPKCMIDPSADCSPVQPDDLHSDLHEFV